MPHIHPGTLIIELKSFSINTLLSLLSELVDQGVLEVLLVTSPSVVDISINEKTYSIALAPFTILVTSPQELSVHGELRVYKTIRDAWVDAVKLSTHQLLGLLESLSIGNYRVLLEHDIVVESEDYCEDVVFSFSLTAKTTNHSTLREHSLTRAYALYREMLKEQKVLLAICVADSTMSPYAWIEKRNNRITLVLRKPRNPGEERVALKVLLDYLATRHSKTANIELQKSLL
jgi:hypothetical protein